MKDGGDERAMSIVGGGKLSGGRGRQDIKYGVPLGTARAAARQSIVMRRVRFGRVQLAHYK
jgi:hypothetical protein